jgi:hypothetical protein
MKRPKSTILPALVPSATTHGAFAKIAIFPHESKEEYERLRLAVMEEFKPNGPTEVDAVETVTRCIWRKRRVEAHIAAKLAERQNNREQTARAALGALRLDPDSVGAILRTCAPDICQQIDKKFPRANYTTESEWNSAARDHLEMVLRSELIPPDGEEVPPSQPDWTFFFTPKSSDLSDEQLIDLELKTIERLDAMMDHVIKRLGQIKTMKQLMNSADLHLYVPDVIQLPTSTSRGRKRPHQSE